MLALTSAESATRRDFRPSWAGAAGLARAESLAAGAGRGRGRRSPVPTRVRPGPARAARAGGRNRNRAPPRLPARCASRARADAPWPDRCAGSPARRTRARPVRKPCSASGAPRPSPRRWPAPPPRASAALPGACPHRSAAHRSAPAAPGTLYSTCSEPERAPSPCQRRVTTALLRSSSLRAWRAVVAAAERASSAARCSARPVWAACAAAKLIVQAGAARRDEADQGEPRRGRRGGGGRTARGAGRGWIDDPARAASWASSTALRAAPASTATRAARRSASWGGGSAASAGGTSKATCTSLTKAASPAMVTRRLLSSRQSGRPLRRIRSGRPVRPDRSAWRVTMAPCVETVTAAMREASGGGSMPSPYLMSALWRPPPVPPRGGPPCGWPIDRCRHADGRDRPADRLDHRSGWTLTAPERIRGSGSARSWFILAGRAPASGTVPATAATRRCTPMAARASAWRAAIAPSPRSCGRASPGAWSTAGGRPRRRARSARDHDELEGRFPAGAANLSTISLTTAGCARLRTWPAPWAGPPRPRTATSAPAAWPRPANAASAPPSRASRPAAASTAATCCARGSACRCAWG